MAVEEMRCSSELRRRAEKRVAEKLAFYRHLAVFFVVNAFLLATNIIVFRDFLWSLIPLSAWAIALLIHFLTVFAFGGDRVEQWREREIQKEIERLSDKR